MTKEFTVGISICMFAASSVSAVSSMTSLAASSHANDAGATYSHYSSLRRNLCADVGEACKKDADCCTDNLTCEGSGKEGKTCAGPPTLSPTMPPICPHSYCENINLVDPGTCQNHESLVCGVDENGCNEIQCADGCRASYCAGFNGLASCPNTGWCCQDFQNAIQQDCANARELLCDSACDCECTDGSSPVFDSVCNGLTCPPGTTPEPTPKPTMAPIVPTPKPTPVIQPPNPDGCPHSYCENIWPCCQNYEYLFCGKDENNCNQLQCANDGCPATYCAAIGGGPGSCPGTGWCHISPPTASPTACGVAGENCNSVEEAGKTCCNGCEGSGNPSKRVCL